ncbi:DUF2793 domain-containing protein [Xanthobacter sp. V4C-4]|uniref:DUF2793 domain-containing protein n=1 Tax=Xanthobacter cornucopiae TaxID=3119924 RepID=UPI00372C0D41
MASDQSANLALPYLAAAQAQKHVTHNEALRALDAHVQLALESVTMSAPPATPEEGARWFVPAGATGAFAGQAGRLAAYEGGAFDFLALPRDALAYVRDEARFARFDGGAWVAPFSAAADGQLVLESVTATAPPAAPAAGARWFVPAGASGAFSGQAGTVATYERGAFTFSPLSAGRLAFIRDQWRLVLYDGGGFVSPLAAMPTRSAIEAEMREEDLILSGASTDTTIVIPARAIVLGVSTRVLSEVTGATSYECGIAGEVSKFGGMLGIALGASNSGVIGPTAFYAATAVRLTATGGVFTGGRVRVSIHLLRCPVSAFPEREAAWWTDAAHLVEGAAPVLAADFSRERYALNGAHASSTSIVQRSGAAKAVVSASGARVLAPANALAFDYASGRRRMVMEGTSTNLFVGSAAPAAAQGLSVTAQAYTLAFEGTGTLALSGAHAHVVAGTGSNDRVAYSFTPVAGTLTLTPAGDVRKVQVEANSIPTSYVETTSMALARVTDVCPWSSAAAARLSAAGANTVVLRGRVASQVSSQNLLRAAGGTILRAQTTTALGLMGAATVLTISGAVIPGEAGVAIAWDPTGRAGSVNGGAVYSDATALTYDMATVHFGTNGGLYAGARYDIDALLVWAVRAGAPALQAQARVWA